MKIVLYIMKNVINILYLDSRKLQSMSDTDPEPDFVDSVFQDESEDEVFFGKISDKEKTGKYSVYVSIIIC